MNEIVTNRAFMYEATSAILGIMMSQTMKQLVPQSNLVGAEAFFFLKLILFRDICIGADHMSENNL